MIWPLEPEIAREFAHGLDEMLVVEEKGPFVETLLKEALYGTAERAADPRQAGRARRAAAPARARPRRRPDRPRPGRRASSARGVRDRLGGGAPAQARRDPRPPGGAADGAAHAVLLLRLPAQQLREGARGHARGRRHRLPHDGAAEPRGQGRDHRHHADGRRGRAVDRHGARSPTTATSSRTSATAPSTTRARSRCARRSRPA